MIFITGFHHSGTSILAEAVERFGYDFGKPLDRHREHEELKKIDDRLIADWMKPWPVLDMSPISVPPGVDAYKNPRLMVTAPAWYKSFPSSKWIVIERDEEDVVTSIMADKNRLQDPIFWVKLRREYSHKFSRFLADLSIKNFAARNTDDFMLLIKYDKMCAYPEYYARAIGVFLGRPEKSEEVGKWMRETLKFKTYSQLAKGK